MCALHDHVIKLTASCDGKIDKITHKWLVPNNDMDRPHIKVWGKVSESCHLWAAKASIKQHVHDCYMMWSRISLKTTQSNCLELWSRSAHMQKQLDWFVKWPVAKNFTDSGNRAKFCPRWWRQKFHGQDISQMSGVRAHDPYHPHFITVMTSSAGYLPWGGRYAKSLLIQYFTDIFHLHIREGCP